MRILLSVAAAALLAGCEAEPSIRINSRDGGQDREQGVLRVVETLQCPQTQGVLTRKGAASGDGLSCTYVGPRGSEVVLRMVRLDGRDASELLAEFERDLRADLPEAMRRLAQTPTPPAPPAAEGEAADNVDVALPGVAVQAQGDNAVVRLPGLSVDAQGENARVRIGGLNIAAEGDSNHVNIQSDNESLQVRSESDATEIRTRDSGGGVRATYVLVDNAPAEGGWQLVGFEARGPNGGPLVIAIVRSKDRREDDLFQSAKDLVTLNVGE